MSETERKPREIGVASYVGPEGADRVAAVVDGRAYPIELEEGGEAATADDMGAMLVAMLNARRRRAMLLSPEVIGQIAENARARVDRGEEPLVEPLPAVFVPPFVLERAFKVLALGRSYRAHALELGNAPLERPIVFCKLPECMVGSGATVRIPADAEGKMDHEAELAIVVGTDAENLRDGDGRAHIAGYTIANDLTLRTVQTAAKKAGHPWLRAKNFPGALPVGPWITPAWAVPEPEKLVITCRVNGEVRQHAPVSQMTWDVGRTVEELSRLWPLRAGDVISTGTPAGVSGLNPGDRCDIEIAGGGISLGVLTTFVASS